MAASMSTIQLLENHEQWQQLYKILAEANPANQSIQRELGKLSNNKDTYIAQLKLQWDSRPVPLFTQSDIKRLCSAFYTRAQEEDIFDELVDRHTNKMSPRDWVVKDNNQWRGFDAEAGDYLENPIRFDGDLLFEKVYEPLIISDRESGSCNLIWSIKKLIKEGGDNALSDKNWIALWLQFAKKYMQSTYSNLSRYSDDLENLFSSLITNVNVDEELSKLRASMSKLHRDPKMPLQIPLYKLKSSYELLLGISFPLMDADEILTKSDSYAVNCAKFFISKNTNSALESYIQLKLTKGERLNVVLVCQLVQRHESNVIADQISATMFLPEHCTRLDTQLVTATNTEQLFIHSSEFQGNKSRHYSGNRKSPYKDGYKQNDKSRKRFTRSPGGTFRSSSNRGRSGSQGRKSSGQQGRRNSHQRVTSKHGRRYSRSPGGKNWYMSSRSPTPNSSYNQNNRGRSGHPTSNQNSCIRCGGAHNSNDCRIYGYYNGDPCQKCGKMHPTAAHRPRSTSNQRAGGSHRISGYESVIVSQAPSLNPVNFLEREAKN